MVTQLRRFRLVKCCVAAKALCQSGRGPQASSMWPPMRTEIPTRAPKAAGFHTAATRRPADSSTATPGMSSGCTSRPALAPLRVAVVAVPAQIYAVTGSSGMVGLTGLFGLVPDLLPSAGVLRDQSTRPDRDPAQAAAFGAVARRECAEHDRRLARRDCRADGRWGVDPGARLCRALPDRHGLAVRDAVRGVAACW